MDRGQGTGTMDIDQASLKSHTDKYESQDVQDDNIHKKVNKDENVHEDENVHDESPIGTSPQGKDR